MKRNIQRIIAMVMATLIILLAIMPGVAENNQVESGSSSGWQNYILVLDNSGSNWSRVDPTDIDGLRYSACTRLFNEMPLNNTRIGLILFAGGNDRFCQRFGPVERNTDEAEQLILQTLMDKSTDHTSDLYTDITYALKAAEEMAMSMPNGNTTIILITDGVNDLTNSGDPLNDPKNIQANSDTVAEVRRITEAGINFYVVGLTAGGRDPVFSREFMGFIEEMGMAGGGIVGEGAYGSLKLSNVFEARADNIGDIVSQILSADTNNEHIEEPDLLTPVDRTYHVKSGVEDVSITISFAPETKSGLSEIYLVSPEPNSVEYLVWKNGISMPVNNSSISVHEDQNYINIRILNPQPGSWGVKVSANKENLRVNNTVVQNQNVELRMEVPSEPIHSGEQFEVRAYFREYVNGDYQDMTDPEFYANSTVQLLLQDPEGVSTPVNMVADGVSMKADVILPKQGAWKLSIFATNDFLSREILDYEIEVLEPIPSIVPVTPTPEPKQVENVQIDIAPLMEQTAENGQLSYIPREAENIQILVRADGEYETCLLEGYEDGKLFQEFSSNVANFEYATDLLERGVPYTIRATLTQANGVSKTVERRIAIYPDPMVITGFDFDATNVMEVKADGTYVTEDGKANLQYSGQSDEIEKVICVVYMDGVEIERKDFGSTGCTVDLKEGSVYTVKAIPIPKYGEESDGEQYAVEKQFTPKVYTLKEKLIQHLPLIGGIIAGLIVLILAAIMAFKALRKKLKGYLHLCISDGQTPENVYVKLTGTPVGKSLAAVQAFKKENSSKNWYSAVSQIVMYQVKVDGNGRISGATAGSFIENADALKIITKAGQYFMDSDNTTVVFNLDQDGKSYELKCCYSVNQEYPQFTMTKSDSNDDDFGNTSFSDFSGGSDMDFGGFDGGSGGDDIDFGAF